MQGLDQHARPKVLAQMGVPRGRMRRGGTCASKRRRTCDSAAFYRQWVLRNHGAESAPKASLSALANSAKQPTAPGDGVGSWCSDPSQNMQSQSSVSGPKFEELASATLRLRGFSYCPEFLLVGEFIRRDINCSVDLRSTTAVGGRRYNRMRKHLCPSV